MDNDNSQAPSGADELKKLEEELKGLGSTPQEVPVQTPAVESPINPSATIIPPTGDLQPTQETPTSPLPTPPAQPTSPPKSSKILMMAISLLVLALAGAAGYLFLNKQSSPKACTEEAKLCSDGSYVGRAGPNCEFAPCPTSTPDPTAGWQRYTNNEHNFSIKYPQGWRVVELATNVGFGPEEIQEDVLWGITYYDKTKNNLEKIKADIGSQFEDRKQTAILVSIGNIETVIKLVTTTPSNPGWYHVYIIIETSNEYIALNNGAVKDENLPFDKGVPPGATFEQFYSTFKFIEATPSASPTNSPTATPSASPQ